MGCERLYSLCFLFSFAFVVSCVPATRDRSRRAAVDYLATANKILDETPLVDGWVSHICSFERPNICVWLSLKAKMRFV